MYKSILLILTIAIAMSACSKTVKGPVTGKKYNVNVGGWDDMQKYKKAREEATTPVDPEAASEKPVDCSQVDCPDENR